jgi:hypothetical protein
VGGRKGLWAKTEVREAGGKGFGLYLLEDVKVRGLRGGTGGCEGWRWWWMSSSCVAGRAQHPAAVTISRPWCYPQVIYATQRRGAQAGQLIAEYVGEVISMRELDLRRKQRRTARHLYFLGLPGGEVCVCVCVISWPMRWCRCSVGCRLSLRLVVA